MLFSALAVFFAAPALAAPAIYGATNSYVSSDIATCTKALGTSATGFHVYAVEHGTYNTTLTGYHANILVFSGTTLKAVFTECSTLPDAPQTLTSDKKYPAIVNPGTYKLTIYPTLYKKTGAHAYYVLTTSGSGTLPCLRYDYTSKSYKSYTCDAIRLHAGGSSKSASAPSSTGCINIKGATNMNIFYSLLKTSSATLTIIRNTAPNVTLSAGISPTSVAKSGTVTCTLTTSQTASGVTATLNGNKAKTMTATNAAKTQWKCTFTNFSATGTRTVVFKAVGTNGKAVTTPKTFTVSAATVANVTLSAGISPTSVAKTGTVTCTLTTSQAASGVTATLNGNAAKSMTATNAAKTQWKCTFTNFTSTGTRTVVFKAIGTNGKAVTTSKTFTVSAATVANVTLSASISPSVVAKNGTVTCLLTTSQAASGVTATLNGNPAKTMTALNTAKTQWECTFTNFTSTGTRTVVFKATGTNGKAVTLTKTFVITS